MIISSFFFQNDMNSNKNIFGYLKESWRKKIGGLAEDEALGGAAASARRCDESSNLS